MNTKKTVVNRVKDLLSTGKEADVRFLVGTGAAKKEMTHYVKTNVRTNKCSLLNYIYSDKLDGLNQDSDTAVLYAAKKYNIVGLINACLNCILDTDGVLTALKQARFYHEKHEKLANYEFWNVEEAEGFLEFGKNGLVTVKNQGSHPYGIINALKPLLIKGRGIAYYELKLIDFPQGRDVMFGIGQKTMPLSTFYVFRGAWRIADMYNPSRPSGGDVFGCIVKFSSKQIFITRNGELYYGGDLQRIVKLDKPLDMMLAIKLTGDGCSVQLGRIEMSDNEGECPF